MKSLKRMSVFAIVLALVTVLLAPCVTAGAKAEQFTLTGINTDRGEGALIVYNSDFGETTNTNQWGAEAIVDSSNKCVSVSTSGNSRIPEGGFVVSGHDANEGDAKNATFVKNSIKVGTYVYYNKKAMTLTLSDTPITPSHEYTVSKKIDGTDVYRNVDMLVIYNTSGARTLTNDWGVEAVVTDGVVTSVGGNNNLVPNGTNSFVVSGHGTAYDWINLNVLVGMTAEIKDGNIVFGYTAKAALLSLQEGFSELKKEYDAALDQCLLIDRTSAKAAVDLASAALNTANAKFDAGSDDFWASFEECERLLAEGALTVIESQKVEYRGVWLRPVQTNQKAVDDYVQKLYDSGINLICIETLYNNCMIMPTPSGSLFEQNPSWKGFDMLQAFIDSCHKRGMELHIWMPVYYVGHEDTENCQMSVGYKKPEWLSITDRGNTMGANNPNKFYMLDPSNPEVKQCLLDTYRWILQKYDIDGFELDYIRYWERGEEDYGYNRALVDAFEKEYGVTPEYDTKASYWQDWCDFRGKYVTDMVHATRELIDEVRPGTLLSLDVGGYPSIAKRYLYQDYLSWLDEGIVDLLHPMCYGEDYDDVFIDLAEKCDTRTMLCVGLGTFDNAIPTDCIKGQAILINKVGGNGSCFFEATSYFNRMMPKLLAGLYADRAVTPTDSDAVKLKLGEISKRLEMMKQDGKITDKTAQKISDAANALNKSDVTDDEIGVLVKALADVKESGAKEMLSNDIHTLARILAVSDMMEWSPEKVQPDTSNDPSNDPAGDDSSIPNDVSDDESGSDEQPDQSGGASEGESGSNSNDSIASTASNDANNSDALNNSSVSNVSGVDEPADGTNTVLIVVIVVLLALAVIAAVIIIIRRKKQ